MIKIVKPTAAHQQLFEAINNGTLEDVISVLDKYKPDVNLNTWEGTAIVMACRKGNIEIVKYLLSYGADPNFNALDKNENSSVYFSIFPTALKSAVELNSVEIVKLLIKSNVDVNLLDGTGCSPLYMAVKNDNPAIVQLLLEAGADVNIKLRQPHPLTIAIAHQNFEIVGLLLNAGAEILNPTPYRNGKSIRVSPSDYGNQEITDIIKAGDIKKGDENSTLKLLLYALGWQVILMIAGTSLVYYTWNWLIAPAFKFELPVPTICGFWIIVAFWNYKPRRSSYFKSTKEMTAFGISYLLIMAILFIMAVITKLFIS